MAIDRALIEVLAARCADVDRALGSTAAGRYGAAMADWYAEAERVISADNALIERGAKMVTSGVPVPDVISYLTGVDYPTLFTFLRDEPGLGR